MRIIRDSLERKIGYKVNNMAKRHKHNNLVDLINNRLHSNTFNGKRFYNTIDKEVEYGYSNGCFTGEIDNIAIRHGRRFTYVLLFEDKSNPGRESKAVEQLERERRYLSMKKYNKNFRIFTFYVHGLKNDKYGQTYKIKREL